MHTARLFSTVIVALLLMGCPPPVSDTSNPPAQSSDNPDNSASGGNNPEPKAIVVKQVSAGGEHSMILKSDDTLWAVGSNQFGQLGNDKSGADTEELNPIKVMDRVDKVSAGKYHSMILKKNGELWAVGRNGYGQLGDGTKENRLTPVQVKNAAGEPMTEVAQVSAGGSHTMIVMKNGELWAVGRNDNGQLGDGTKTNRAFPVQVKTATGEPMTQVAQVSAGGQHSMIVVKNGELWAVGNNNKGQLGDSSTTKRLNPVRVKEIPNEGGSAREMTGIVTQVSAGDAHSMILKKDNTLWAVGQNRMGQLADGTKNNTLTPIQVMADVAQVSASLPDDTTAAGHTMIVVKNGELWAVGTNRYGQLGKGSASFNPGPALRLSMTNVAQVSSGSSHSMILKNDNTLWAVGRNDKGQLGDGSTSDKFLPVEITVE